MLHIISIENRSQVNNLFAKYNPHQQSWLVPDLRTKFELQQKILEQNDFYLDESVLRASDLWRTLLKRVQPNLRIVSDAFAHSILRKILEEIDFGVTASSEDTVFSYIDLLAPIIFHPRGKDQLMAWFEDHPEAKNRWQDWFIRAQYCAFFMVEKYNIITSNWVASFLQANAKVEDVWKTSLVVDLGAEFSRAELDLIRNISRSVDVTVIEPAPKWKSEFSYLLKVYEDLGAQSQSKERLEVPAYSEKKKEVLRFSGMLAEIKNATGQIREWLNSGIEANSISVIAPDIEAYWPVLQVLLAEEGIITQKDVKQKMQGLPSVNRWLANLRTKSGGLSASDLELAFFGNAESQNIRHEMFKSLFKNLYGQEDFARNDLIHKLFHENVDVKDMMDRDTFILNSIKYWESAEAEIIQVVLREILQNATKKMIFSWKEWLTYLQTIVATKEILISKGDSAGILVTKLMSGHSAKSRYRIFLGLTDENLKTRQKTQLSGKDYFEIANSLGFYLENPDQSDLDFELHLLADADSSHDIYCFGATDLTGTLCSPAKFWMNLVDPAHHEVLALPKETRWDELQYSICHRSWVEGARESLEKRIEQDLGKAELASLVTDQLPRISASAIENYLSCPFVFAAQRYFKLKDLPEVDLDIDHRTRGTLAHALFEKITEETVQNPMRFDWTANELDATLEVIKKERELIFADDRLWGPLKKRHIDIGLRFLEFEKSWRTEFKKVRTIGREKRFEFYLNPQSEVLTRQAAPGSFRISGQIDRIDSDGEGNIIVLDYKSSSAGNSAHGSWFEKNELQLLFYMWVIEKSLMEDIQGEVVGLFYFMFKTFEHKGFMLADFTGQAYPEFKKKDKSATDELKEKYIQEFSKVLMQTLDRIRLGEISPIPSDAKTCQTCEWRRQCRAPHLN